MNTQERTLPNAVIILGAITIAIGAILVAVSLGAFSSPTQATDVDPTPQGGNPTCSDFQGSQTWIELKVDPPSDGDHTKDALTVTISNLTDDTFNWSSNIGVDAVFVKGGPEGNLYLYDPEETSDTGLTTTINQNNQLPYDISHISFCFDEEPQLTVEKVVVNDDGGTAVASDFTMTVTATNPSPASFPGDSGGTIVTLEAGTYSVSETGPSGYTESQSADCSGTIAIGENKTCTITNDDVPPAAEATPTPTPPPPLAAVQEPEALPASGGAPADGSGLGTLALLLGLGGLALLSGAGTLVAVKVRRQR